MSGQRADVQPAWWAGRLAAIVLAGGLLAGCTEAWDTVSRPIDPLPPADPQDVDAPQQGAGEYPSLSSVPDAPPRRPSGREERQQIRDSLSSDRANARYTNEQQTGEGISASPRSGGQGADSQGAPDQSAGATSAPSSTAGASSRDGAQDPGGTGAGTPRSDAPERADLAQGMPEDDAGASASSGGRAAAADSPDGAEQTDRQQQSRDGPAGQTAGQTAGRSGGSAAAPDVPQLKQSRQGEPIEVPSQPDLDGGATTGRSGGETATRAGRGQEQQSASRENQGSATASGPEVGQSRTLSRQDAGGQPMADGGRRVAVIYFRHGSASLRGRDREVLRQVAQIHQRRGRDLRVIGHASSRTAAMDPVDHRMANFDTSLTRAQAVVDALVAMGVPRDAIQLEARGDNEPVYHEFMPTGEAGNRRAEIFLQG